ncbi:MAG: aminotransferase class I/II-fold pyridoxal phosphate-dependent enzyme [Vampirovibrionales bacterium]
MSPSSPPIDSSSALPIAQALAASQYASVRFHVPGHQGRPPSQGASPGIGPEWFTHDLTELDTLDDLSHPTGCIAQSQAWAAKHYQTQATFYLTSGSTLGLQAALLALAKPNAVVLIPRNAHRAVVNGLILTGSLPYWIMPPHHAPLGLWQGLTLEAVQEAHQAAPQAQGVILPSPTYEGLMSEIDLITSYCQRHGLWLIVDEAHGSLLPAYDTLASDSLPTSAIRYPATVVVQSLHKGAGAITPAAIAHLPKGSSLHPQQFQSALNVLQTSSPSWPLLANIEATIARLFEPQTTQHLKTLIAATQQAVQTLLQSHNSWVFPESFKPKVFSLKDPLAFVIGNTHHLATLWASAAEEQHGIAYEAIHPNCALYKVGLGASPSDLEALVTALNQVITEHPLGKAYKRRLEPLDLTQLPKPQVAYSPKKAWTAQHQSVPLCHAVGHVAAETWAPCPPGIPLWIPGEVIQPAHLAWIQAQHAQTNPPKTVQVVQNPLNTHPAPS